VMSRAPAATTMTGQEKALYHQIHPVKLAVDALSALAAVALLWRHALAPGLIVGLMPPAIASLALIQTVDLERWKRSALGHYLERHMSWPMVMLRLAGFVVMLAAAWFHLAAILFAGLVAILYAWLRGAIVAAGRPGVAP